MTAEERICTKEDGFFTIANCQHEASVLHGLLQGLEILIFETASQSTSSPASNAVGALSGAVVERAKRLSESIENLEVS